MNTYTIRQVAAITNAKEDTLRRYIRAGRLKGTKTSNKKGFVITQEDLNDFLKGYRKYARTSKPKLSDSFVNIIQEEVGEYISEHWDEIMHAIAVKVMEDMLENLKTKEEP